MLYPTADLEQRCFVQTVENVNLETSFARPEETIQANCLIELLRIVKLPRSLMTWLSRLHTRVANIV